MLPTHPTFRYILLVATAFAWHGNRRWWVAYSMKLRRVLAWRKPAGYWYHWLPMYLWLKSMSVWFWIIHCFLAFRGEPLGKFCKSFRKWRRNSSLIQLIWDWGKAKQPPGPAVNGVAAIQRAAACGSNEWSFISCQSCSIHLCRYDILIHFYWIGLWMDCKFAFSSVVSLFNPPQLIDF